MQSFFVDLAAFRYTDQTNRPIPCSHGFLAVVFASICICIIIVFVVVSDCSIVLKVALSSMCFIHCRCLQGFSDRLLYLFMFPRFLTFDILVVANDLWLLA